MLQQQRRGVACAPRCRQCWRRQCRPDPSGVLTAPSRPAWQAAHRQQRVTGGGRLREASGKNESCDWVGAVAGVWQQGSAPKQEQGQAEQVCSIHAAHCSFKPKASPAAQLFYQCTILLLSPGIVDVPHVQLRRNLHDPFVQETKVCALEAAAVQLPPPRTPALAQPLPPNPFDALPPQHLAVLRPASLSKQRTAISSCREFARSPCLASSSSSALATAASSPLFLE